MNTISTRHLLFVVAVGIGLPCGIWACGKRGGHSRDVSAGAAIDADSSPRVRAAPPPGEPYLLPEEVAPAPANQTVIVVTPPPAARAQIAPAQVVVFEVPALARCGPVTCDVGQVCCNASCGLCTALGASCSQALCGR